MLDGLRVSDNVVWQFDSLDDYASYAQRFVDASILRRPGMRLSALRTSWSSACA